MVELAAVGFLALFAYGAYLTWKHPLPELEPLPNLAPEMTPAQEQEWADAWRDYDYACVIDHLLADIQERGA